MIALPRMAGRVAAVSLLLALPVTAWLAAVQPVVDFKQALDGRIAEDRALLERYRLTAAKRDALAAQRDAIAARAAEGIGFLKGDSAQIAAAQLQNEAKAIIQAQKGTLRSSQVLNTQMEGDYTQIGIRLALSVEIEGLQGILHRLESRESALFVDNLEIRAAAKARSSKAVQPRRLLEVRFDLFGYLKGEAS